MIEKLLPAILWILQKGESSINGQLVARTPAWLRAILGLACLALVIWMHHLGWLNNSEATAWGSAVVGTFGLQWVKSLRGEGISFSILQAPIQAKPIPGTVTASTPVYSTPVAPGESVAVLPTKTAEKIIPLGPEFSNDKAPKPPKLDD